MCTSCESEAGCGLEVGNSGAHLSSVDRGRGLPALRVAAPHADGSGDGDDDAGIAAYVYIYVF